MFPRVTHPSATPTRRWAFDLHVLSLPPAFVLSQDQTLKLKNSKSANPTRHNIHAQPSSRTSRRVPDPQHPPQPQRTGQTPQTRKRDRRRISLARASQRKVRLSANRKDTAAHVSLPSDEIVKQHRTPQGCPEKPSPANKRKTKKTTTHPANPARRSDQASTRKIQRHRISLRERPGRR